MADAADLENPADYSDLRDEVLESRAELAALRAEVEGLRKAAGFIRVERDAARAEVERLKDMRERELEYVRHTARNTDLAAWARNRATVDRPEQGKTK